MKASAKLDERELVAAVLRKDRKASAEFVGLYADLVYSYVRHRLAPRTDLVEDLVQDIFLAAWESLAPYRGDAPLRGWAMGIARHRIEDFYRSRFREPLPQDELTEMLVDTEAEFALDESLDEERLRRKREKYSKPAGDLRHRPALALLGKADRPRNGYRYWPDGESD